MMGPKSRRISDSAIREALYFDGSPELHCHKFREDPLVTRANIIIEGRYAIKHICPICPELGELVHTLHWVYAPNDYYIDISDIEAWIEDRAEKCPDSLLEEDVVALCEDLSFEGFDLRRIYVAGGVDGLSGRITAQAFFSRVISPKETMCKFDRIEESIRRSLLE